MGNTRSKVKTMFPTGGGDQLYHAGGTVWELVEKKGQKRFFCILKREEIAAWVDGNENHLERERKHWGCGRKR